MKRTILSISARLLLVPALNFAAQQTWTGEISDSICGANHQAMAKSGQKVNLGDCTPSGAPDIVPERLTEAPVRVSVDDLLAKVRAQNPDIRGRQQMIQNKSVQLEIAHKDFYPDFTVGYMWQHTASQYRDYYMLTVGARIPIHRSRKQWPEVEQAVEELHQSRRDYEAQIQEAYFEVRDQYLKAQTAERVLDIYRQGLIPQAANTFKAGVVAYETNREDFETLLNSFLDVLRLDEEYWRNLLDHELAVAGLEQISGVRLNEAAR